MNSLKRRFNAAIKEVSDLLNENREIKEENMAVFLVCKENIEGQLQKYCKEFERFEETLEENEENEKILVNYESVIIEASQLLNQLKGVIKRHQQTLEATQRENQRKAEAEERENQRKAEAKERENQRKAELEREKLRINEKLQLEKVNLERLKIEADANLQKEKLESEVRLREAETKKRDTDLETNEFRHEVEKLTAQNHSPVSKRTSLRLPRIELKKFGVQIIKWQEFWDTFEATIHKNPSLKPIEKFNYLRAQLENEALKSIAGLELTNANYEAAINLLKERYGNNQLIVVTHYTKIMEMPPASNKTTS